MIRRILWAAEQPARTGPPEDIHLGTLAFEIQGLDDRGGPIRDFLLAFVGEEIPTNDALSRYLDEVLPQGLPGTLLVSNVGDDPAAPEYLRSLLCPVPSISPSPVPAPFPGSRRGMAPVGVSRPADASR